MAFGELWLISILLLADKCDYRAELQGKCFILVASKWLKQSTQSTLHPAVWQEEKFFKYLRNKTRIWQE